MRFDSSAYDKLYPRTDDSVEETETAVEGFTPTADEQNSQEGGDSADGSDSTDASE